LFSELLTAVDTFSGDAAGSGHEAANRTNHRVHKSSLPAERLMATFEARLFQIELYFSGLG
jgi:hypothetical protein